MGRRSESGACRCRELVEGVIDIPVGIRVWNYGDDDARDDGDRGGNMQSGG